MLSQFSREHWLNPKSCEEPDGAQRDWHRHHWRVYCTDVQALSVTVFCRCGAVAEVQRLSPRALQAALEGQS